MIPTTFFAAAAVLSSFSAFTGAVVVPRDGTFTYLTPQPTAPGTAAPVSSTASTHSTHSTQSTYSSTASATSIYTTSSTPSTTQSTYSTQPTYTTPTTPQTTPIAYPTTTDHSTAYPQPPSGSNPPPFQFNCDGVQRWQENLAYVAGNKVIFDGKLYTAKQWSYNNSPASSAGEWSLDSDCTRPISNKANCSGVAAWQKSQAYTSGSKVIYNGHLWLAVQWTTSNVPGDTSGTWKDQGACA
ncbi:carbohydrate-binding module family 5 protein [Paxillus rubicundulus Ve08.2h10]|uniref:Carbohydrate-binding module family 5 protein n=1 Tax=Paxillus rubicundulus Ve08.2h10 TaxID=930991 RepID=A0A0D0DAP8_9AGAM|nr:carbohydrate-binding module family 5 protein [Paxillus rubicundulus Ve08.2h10]